MMGGFGLVCRGHLCIKVRDCNLAGVFFSRAKPD